MLQDFSKSALDFDRVALNGRPVFISPFANKNEAPTVFKYPTTLDLNTVFVSGLLRKDIENEDISKHFCRFGEIKEVRLISDKLGKLRGIAYVEYLKASAAAKAVEALNGTTLYFDKGSESEERTCKIKVAISNPESTTQKHQKEDKGDILNAKLVHKTSQVVTRAQPGPRDHMRKHLNLMPRSLSKKSSLKSSSTAKTQAKSQTDSGKGGSMSNDDFRKLLFQGKQSKR